MHIISDNIMGYIFKKWSYTVENSKNLEPEIDVPQYKQPYNYLLNVDCNISNSTISGEDTFFKVDRLYYTKIFNIQDQQLEIFRKGNDGDDLPLSKYIPAGCYGVDDFKKYVSYI